MYTEQPPPHRPSHPIKKIPFQSLSMNSIHFYGNWKPLALYSEDRE